MANEINNNIDMDDLIQLLSRLEVDYVNILGSYYDMFYSDEPKLVHIEYIDASGTLQSSDVPNRTMVLENMLSGEGSPENSVSGHIGATYQDLTNGDLYIKMTTSELNYGWKKVVTEDFLDNWVIRATGTPEGQQTAILGTLYIDVSDGSGWVKLTNTGNTGWIQVFGTGVEFANVSLSNLDNIGEDKLRTSNMYITGSSQTADVLGYKQLEWMYHSQIDTSKFEVEGNPIILSDGGVTGLGYTEVEVDGEVVGKENYILIPNDFFDVSSNPWRFEWAGIMNHRTNSVTYMLGNDSTRQNPNSFLNVYRGANSNNLYFTITTNTGGDAGVASNVHKVGAISDTNNVLSGFESDKYATLENTFTPNSKGWEFNTYITTNTDITSKQTIIASSNKQNAPFKIEIMNSNLVLTLCSSDEQAISTLTSDESLFSSTGYYIKLVFNTVDYTLSFRQDESEDWTTAITIPSATPVYSDAEPQAIIALGIQCSNATTIYPFFGSIDLGKTNILIDGQVFWSGTYRTGIPTQSDVIYLTINPEDEGKEFKAYISYEGLITNRYTFAIKFEDDEDWHRVSTILSGRTLDRGLLNLPFGYKYGLNEVLKLNYVKMYVNTGDGLIPRFSFNQTGYATLTNGNTIQYVESITGSKIVNVAYRDVLEANYAIDGVSEFYVIDENTEEAYLPMGELYGMIFRKPNMSDIPKYTSQLVNDSGFITSNLVYCVAGGHSDENGNLDIIDYVPSQSGVTTQTVDLIYTSSPSKPVHLEFPSPTQCTIEVVSGGAGGKSADGIYVVGGYGYYMYTSGATGAYYKGKVTLTTGDYNIVVGKGGLGGANSLPKDGGLTKFGLSGGADILVVGGGTAGNDYHWQSSGSGGELISSSGVTQVTYKVGRIGAYRTASQFTTASSPYTSIVGIPQDLIRYGRGGRYFGPGTINFSSGAMSGTGGYFKLSYQVEGVQARVGFVNYTVSPDEPLSIIKKDGTRVEIEGINTDLLDDLTVGETYHKFVDETGAELLNNTIYAQLPEPLNPQNDDVWVKFGEPLEVYKYVNGEWTDYDKVHIATFEVVTLADGITKGLNEDRIKCATFFDNKFQLNASNCPYIIEYFHSVERSAGYVIYSNGFCEQWGLTTNIDSGGVWVEFLVDYKDITYNTTLVSNGGDSFFSSVGFGPQVTNKTEKGFIATVQYTSGLTRAEWSARGFVDLEDIWK